MKFDVHSIDMGHVFIRNNKNFIVTVSYSAAVLLIYSFLAGYKDILKGFLTYESRIQH